MINYNILSEKETHKTTMIPKRGGGKERKRREGKKKSSSLHKDARKQM